MDKQTPSHTPHPVQPHPPVQPPHPVHPPVHVTQPMQPPHNAAAQTPAQNHCPDEHDGQHRHGFFRRTVIFTIPRLSGRVLNYGPIYNNQNNLARIYPQQNYNGYVPTQPLGGPRYVRTGNSGPSWFDGIISQFYDKKDGFKIGGALGLIGGALLGANMLGTGSWLSIAGVAVMALAGAWGANKLVDSVGASINKNSQEPTTPARGPAQNRTTTPPAPQHDATLAPISPSLQDQARSAASGTTGISGGSNHDTIQVPTGGPVAGTQPGAQPGPTTPARK